MLAPKLYGRQNVAAQNPAGINQPQSSDQTAEKVFNTIAQTTKKLSEENFALGRVQLINDVLSTSYNQAKDNPKQFNKLVKSGLEKGMEGLPDNIKAKIVATAKDKISSLQIKVGNNLNARLDKENTARVTGLMEGLQTAPGYGLNDINKSISQALAMGRPREEVEQLQSKRDNLIKQMSTLTNAKNMKGSYILGKKTREAIQNGSIGSADAIVEAYEQLDLEGLKKFDAETFGDKNRFMKATMIDSDTYEKISKNIKQRRKDLGDEEKRIIKDQMYYNAAVLQSKYNPEEMKKIKESGSLSDEEYSALEKTIKKSEGAVINPALLTSNDDSFLRQFSKIAKVAGSKDDGTEDYKKRLFMDMIDAKSALVDMRNQIGSSKEDAEIMDRLLTESAASQLFANTFNQTFEEGSALGELLKTKGSTDIKYLQSVKPITNILGQGTAEEKIAEARARGDFVYEEKIYENRMGTRIDTGRTETRILRKEDVLTGRTKDAMDEVAANGLKRAVAIAMNARMPGLDESQQRDIYAAASQAIEDANRDVIRIKAREFINAPEMARLEKELAQGKKAMFNYGGDVFEFKGFTNNNILINRAY